MGPGEVSRYCSAEGTRRGWGTLQAHLPSASRPVNAWGYPAFCKIPLQALQIVSRGPQESPRASRHLQAQIVVSYSHSSNASQASSSPSMTPKCITTIILIIIDVSQRLTMPAASASTCATLVGVLEMMNDWLQCARQAEDCASVWPGSAGRSRCVSVARAARGPRCQSLAQL